MPTFSNQGMTEIDPWIEIPDLFEVKYSDSQDWSMHNAVATDVDFGSDHRSRTTKSRGPRQAIQPLRAGDGSLKEFLQELFGIDKLIMYVHSCELYFRCR